MESEFTSEFTIAGEVYTARADLRAFMGIHELAASQPDMFADIPDRPGELRVIMSPANAPTLFALFTDRPAAHWQKVITACNPAAVMQAWGVCINLLGQAHDAWGVDSDNPFCRQSP